MKRSQRLQKCTHEALESISITTKEGSSTCFPTIVEPTDDLEYLDISIIAPEQPKIIRPPTIATMAAGQIRHTNPSPSPNVDVLLWDQSPAPMPSLHVQQTTSQITSPSSSVAGDGQCQGGICRRICPDAFLPVAVPPPPRRTKRSASRTLRTGHRHQRLDAILGHFRDGHRSLRSRQEAYRSGFFTNMPEPVDLDHQCVICWITRSTRIPRGLPVDWAKIRAGCAEVAYWNAKRGAGILFSSRLLLTLHPMISPIYIHI